MVDTREAGLTFGRTAELLREPVTGNFDVAHLREVHRRIFQDLPEHGPGEFRPEARGHFKERRLESSHTRITVEYALRGELDRKIGPTLDALQGGKALANLDTLDMSRALASTYAKLDYLHPFKEGNSRTLRVFTQQLARENGHALDWGTTNATARTRDALYVARDLAVIQERYPGLKLSDYNPAVDPRAKGVAASQLFSLAQRDPLQEIIRRSLELGRDPRPVDRRMTSDQARRAINTLAPIALNQAIRTEERTRVAAWRQKGPDSDHDAAKKTLAWVKAHGSSDALQAALARIGNRTITVRETPGVPAIKRLAAIASAIERQQRRERPSPTNDRAATRPPRER